MNNEEKILSMLEALTVKIDGLESKVDGLESKVDKLGDDVTALKGEQAEIKETLNIVFDRTAAPVESHTELAQKINDLTDITKQNTYDIARLKIRLHMG